MSPDHIERLLDILLNNRLVRGDGRRDVRISGDYRGAHLIHKVESPAVGVSGVIDERIVDYLEHFDGVVISERLLRDSYVVVVRQNVAPAEITERVDYDSGASEVNQLNRIKLMLATAMKNI